MNINELRKKDNKFLHMELSNLLREKFNLRMQFTSGKLKQSHLLKKSRRNIAKIKMLLSE
ncbi:50S ribosomal protein L29 [Buchnera aphidicola (Formosaphis micheliae)]|uniref:50S ribosomal protein L29 n=1 Tax=Buchnera aphidicola TaxID=9 RepID=UPI0031B87A16